MNFTWDMLPRLATSVVFLLLMLMSCIRIVAKGDDTKDSFKKIVGGLGVFLVAIIANHTGIYILSFFIGGLLIATESFLFFLATVLRANRGDLKDISETYRKMTYGEVRAKITSESEDTANPSTQPGSARQTKPKQLADAFEVEAKVLDYVRTQVESSLRSENLRLEPYVVITSEGKDRGYDAVVINSETSETKFAVEVRFIDSSRTNQRTTETVRQTATRLGNSDISTLLCVVLSKHKSSLENDLLHLKNDLTKQDIGLAIFAMRTNELDVVNDDELQKLLPQPIIS